MKNLLSTLCLAVLGLLVFASPVMADIGYADFIVDYYDSGAGPLTGPYGGYYPDSFPISVLLDVVLGDDPGSTIDFLSLPTGSYVTVGFSDETVIDGIGDDIFIQEVGANNERAEVYVSSDNSTFTFLGIANDSVTTSFDLGTIGYLGQVTAIKIVGLDNLGGSPGFDVVNVEVLPGSIGPAVPVPGAAILGVIGISMVGAYTRKRRQRAIGVSP